MSSFRHELTDAEWSRAALPPRCQDPERKDDHLVINGVPWRWGQGHHGAISPNDTDLTRLAAIVATAGARLGRYAIFTSSLSTLKCNTGGRQSLSSGQSAWPVSQGAGAAGMFAAGKASGHSTVKDKLHMVGTANILYFFKEHTTRTHAS